MALDIVTSLCPTENEKPSLKYLPGYLRPYDPTTATHNENVAKNRLRVL